MMLSYFRRFKWLHAVMSGILLYMTLAPFGMVMADAISDAGKAGQTLGTSAYGTGNSNFPMPSGSGSNYSFSGQSINVNEMYPSTSSANTKPSTYYNSAPVDVNNLKGTYDNSDSMKSTGNSGRTTLYNEAQSINSANSNTWTGSIDANVYALAKGTHDISNANGQAAGVNAIKNSTRIQQASATGGYASVINSMTGACSPTTTISNATKTVHIPDYQNCTIAASLPTNCSINHNYSVKTYTVDLYAGYPDAGPREIVNFTFDIKNNSISGHNDSQGGGLSSHIDYHGAQSEIVGAINSGMATQVKLVSNTYWSGYPNSDQSTIRNFSSSGSTVTTSVEETNSSSGNQPHTTHMQVTVVVLTSSTYSSNDPLCNLAISMVSSGKCSAGTIGGNNSCETVTGTNNGLSAQICTGGEIANAMVSPAYNAISPVAKTVALNGANCVMNASSGSGGSACYTDINGVEQCPSATSGETCTALEAKQCQFVSTQCLTTSPDGSCTLTEKTYDCGKDVTYEDPEGSTVTACSGNFRCGGSDCADFAQEKNSSFGKAAALLNAVNMMASDMNCTSGDPNTCRVFGGTHTYCKKAVGGMQDCCKSPNMGGVGLQQYLMLFYGAKKLDNQLLVLDKMGGTGSSIGSAYRVMRDPVANTFQDLAKPFADAWDSLSGGVNLPDIGISEALDTFKGQAKQVFGDFIKDAFGEEAKNYLMGEGLNSGIMAQVGSFASMAMTAYTIYVTTVLIVQLIWPCTKPELALAGQKAIKSTHFNASYCHKEYVGLCLEARESYCVFNSPLSRIIQEQVRPLLGTNFGWLNKRCTSKLPFGGCLEYTTDFRADCSGLTIQQVASIDWEKVDLSEWTAMLADNGLYKVPSNLTVDTITGGQNLANGVNGASNNVIERTQQRLIDPNTGKTIDNTAVRNSATNLPTCITGQEFSCGRGPVSPITTTSVLPLSGGNAKLYDGYSPPVRTTWNDSSAYVFGSNLTFTSTLPEAVNVNTITLNADNNDTYRVELSTDGTNWTIAADIYPGCASYGICTAATVNIGGIPTKYVRLSAISGDGSYSAAELTLGITAGQNFCPVNYTYSSSSRNCQPNN